MRLSQAAALFALSGAAAFGQCVPSHEDLDRYPVRKYSGEYSNRAYGFSTSIPRGLTGLEVDNPDYQRGFTIVLADGQAAVTAGAEPNNLDYPDAAAAARGALQLNRKIGRKVLSQQIGSDKLGDRAAQTLRLRYTCGVSSTEYMLVETVLLGGAVYRVSWNGAARLYESNKSVVDALKQSFRVIPRK